MDSKTIILFIQLFSATFLIVAILVQSRGTGFARSSKGSASFTRRGLEKLVYRATFLIAAVFMIVSILQFIL